MAYSLYNDIQLIYDAPPVQQKIIQENISRKESKHLKIVLINKMIIKKGNSSTLKIYLSFLLNNY